MDSHIGYSIGIIVIFVVLSAYFSATETAFTSLNRIRLKNLAGDGDKRAKRVLELESKYDNLLSTILIGNNIVNIGMTAVATALFLELTPQYGATLSTVVVTVVVLIFGEISPKSLAKESPESFAMFSSGFINVLMVILTPINFVFSQWKKLLAKIFKVVDNRGITEDELLTIVEEAETEGNLAAEQSELIQNAIEFNELEAWDVLTPRVDIKAIEIDSTKKDVAKMFMETGYSRLPVYEDDLDKILGVLNQKDFHNYISGSKKTISDYVKPVVYVAGSMKAADLLKKLQVNKTHIAIIVDEYGGTAGLVTMEDIIEELVGDIYDEHDEVESQEITQLQDGSYRVLCSTNVEKMFDYFDEEVELDATTVNGWVVLQLDKLPKAGDTFEYEVGNKLFEGRVIKADERKAIEINLRVTEKPEEEQTNRKGN
ncbi:hemolysin family protein [Anaerovoracaceae bacterium 41-7]|uniref:HlyC/CorC family transporter n=1 Tax=Anaerotruncus colihominis TaxID=169435 RepID=A0A845QGW0_9FIRM|nr:MULTISPECIES: hemolysin family protein [Clostridia]MCI9475315.1 HlyC/CorC family transporter [Emergencia sp.]MCI9638762.1 HlyC/CorC family transporter [Emergencia sp.]NBH61320.1 HlyC/CorC family transporter [Anaerotruncus colihominis]NCF00397.1 HlyC/CorC family transporter [Emergencia sp. 1XD21-10]NCF01975.1 HlyC/CorC family transporter [Anaerotruncus sp. 80]